MLLDNDVFFASTSPPVSDDCLDVLGWEWSATGGGGLEEYGGETGSETPAAVATSAVISVSPPGTHIYSASQTEERGSLLRPNSVVLGRASNNQVEDYFSFQCLKYEEEENPGRVSQETTADGFYSQEPLPTAPSPNMLHSLQSMYYEPSSAPSTTEPPTDPSKGMETGAIYLGMETAASSSGTPAIVTGCDVTAATRNEGGVSLSLSPAGGFGDAGDATLSWVPSLMGQSDGDCSKASRRGRPKRCKGLDVGKRKVESESAELLGRRRMGDVACYRGVYFDQIRHLWRANWPEESVIIDKGTRNVVDVRRCTRTKGFSAKKFGYQEAQRMAIEHREKMTGPGMVRHYVYQQDSQPVIPGSRTAARKSKDASDVDSQSPTSVTVTVQGQTPVLSGS
eukprot:Gregarina_sp_Poly_1__69@NODE_1014_length_5364_cov_36_222201_g694_i1_p1_GENE_NODE_1014_length_5364_cov_36_222201_g694_i1NODE_1014_length_5364_cov_36_222201_g694_i1_p1_ORF_typecomplete_len396_score64_66AP2/PF00847_20/5_8e08_NODE_1014_length_5364_cov_36_222201_g694_i11051292